MHIEFLSISGVAAGKRHDFISNQGKAFAHWSGMTVSTRDRLHKSIFCFKPTHPLSHWLCIVHQQWWEDIKKQIDSTTTSTSSSASASAVSAEWTIAQTLWNVRVDTQYVWIIEEQKQQIKQFQEELAEFNCVWYRTLPGNASREKMFWGHQRRWVWLQQTT